MDSGLISISGIRFRSRFNWEIILIRDPCPLHFGFNGMAGEEFYYIQL